MSICTYVITYDQSLLAALIDAFTYANCLTVRLTRLRACSTCNPTLEYVGITIFWLHKVINATSLQLLKEAADSFGPLKLGR
jgi:hypothetical protein